MQRDPVLQVDDHEPAPPVPGTRGVRDDHDGRLAGVHRDGPQPTPQALRECRARLDLTDEREPAYVVGSSVLAHPCQPESGRDLAFDGIAARAIGAVPSLVLGVEDVAAASANIAIRPKLSVYARMRALPRHRSRVRGRGRLEQVIGKRGHDDTNPSVKSSWSS